MQQKAKKTISHVTPVSPLADEEKKRETFALAILQGISSNPAVVGRKSIVSVDGSFTETAEINNGLVSKAVEMADELLEKLYPLTDGGQSEDVEQAAARYERENRQSVMSSVDIVNAFLDGAKWMEGRR